MSEYEKFYGRKISRDPRGVDTFGILSQVSGLLSLVSGGVVLLLVASITVITIIAMLSYSSSYILRNAMFVLCLPSLLYLAICVGLGISGLVFGSISHGERVHRPGPRWAGKRKAGITTSIIALCIVFMCTFLLVIDFMLLE